MSDSFKLIDGGAVPAKEPACAAGDKFRDTGVEEIAALCRSLM